MLGFIYEIQMKRTKARLERATPIDFADMRMPKSSDEVILLRAETYAPVNPLTVVLGEPPTFANPFSIETEGIRCGDWEYLSVTLPKHTCLQVPFRDERDPAHVAFDADIDIPQIRQRNGGLRPSVWMSTTPAEILSCRGGVRFAKGDVVIGGLGMGWQLHHIAEKKDVKRVVVIERDETIVDWYGRALCEHYGAELIVGDFWKEAPRFDKATTRFVIDVWPKWFDAKHSEKLRAFRKSGYQAWAWGCAR